MKFFIKLYGNVLNFASTKFNLNLFFLRNAFSHVATTFWQMTFIFVNSSTLKIKTLSSIWKNISSIIINSAVIFCIIYLLISIIAFIL